MLPVFGFIGIAAAVLWLVVKVLYEIVDYRGHHFGCAFSSFDVLLRVDEFANSKFNAIVVLKIDEVCVVVRAAPFGVRLSPTVQASTKKPLNLIGMCCHIIAQRYKQGMTKAADIINCLTVDIINVTDIQVHTAIRVDCIKIA